MLTAILCLYAATISAVSAASWCPRRPTCIQPLAEKTPLKPTCHRLVENRGGGGNSSPPTKTPGINFHRIKSWLDRYSSKLFDDADSNHDGSVSPDEVYELILKFYIKVNQKAPIPPPSRERVMKLFDQSDTDRTGRLQLVEFQRLLRTMYARASSRVLAYKVVSILFAPVLSISLINFIQGKTYLKELFNALLPEKTPKKITNLLTKESLWVTMFTMILVKNLGGLILGFVDWMWWGPKDDFYRGMDQLRHHEIKHNI